MWGKSGPVRPPVREKLARCIFYSKRRTVAIVEAKRNAMIKTEIVFSQVAMQMLFAAVLIDPAQAGFFS
jgi:hypothetical protein